MATLQSDIQRLVDAFVAQVTDLARRAAMSSLETAFGGRSTRSNSTTTIPRVGRGRGAKRTGAELEHLQDEFLMFVTKNPGLRIEQINKQLNSTTRELQLPIRKLLAEGYLKAKGKKRSTTYFPGKAKN